MGRGWPATELLLLDKSDDRLEALGLSLAEAKALLAGVQQRLVTAQAASLLPGIEAARSAVGNGAARGRIRSSFAPRLALFRSPVRAFTSAAAIPQTARRSVRWPSCSPSTPRRSCSIWRPAGGTVKLGRNANDSQNIMTSFGQ